MAVLLPAVMGSARLGATPMGFVNSNGFVLIGGVDHSADVRKASVKVTLNLGNTPGSATFRVNGSYQPYKAQILADLPIGYWRMDAASGTTELDRSGNGHTGTITGGVTLNQVGALSDGDAAELFDGSTGFVSVPDAVPLEIIGSLSLEAWVKYTSTVSNGFIISKSAGGTHGYELFRQASTGQLRFSGFGAALGFDYLTTASYNDGAWHHVVATWDGANGHVYVDGALVSITTVTLTGGLVAGTEPLLIGARGAGGSSPFAGAIDEVAVYGYALSAQQVANHYALASLRQPTVGQDVQIHLGTKNNILFGGVIKSVSRVYEGSIANAAYDVTCQDYSWLLDRRKVVARFQNMTYDAIIASIVSTSASGFTAHHVATGLGTVADIAFDGATISEAVAQLAQLAGARSFVDPSKDIWLFVTRPSYDLVTVTNPYSLVTDTDITQIATRVYVRYKGSTAALAVAAGATALPVVSGTTFTAGGGTAVSGGQRITYAAVGLGYTAALTAWAAQAQPAATTLNHAVWAPALGLFVAVGVSTAATSPDGKTWTPRTTPSGTMTRVAWSPTLNLLAAPDSANGKINTSPNGITWTARTMPEANAWTGITWASGLSLFIAVATTGTHRVATSPDGITWTVQSASSVQPWTQVVWAPALSLLVAQASGGTTSSYMSSPDGTTWTTRTSAAVQLFGLTWAPALSLFVSVGTASIYTSPTGVTWTAQTLPSAINLQDVLWIAELGQFVAVDATTTRTATIFLSPDGATWSVVSAAATAELLGIAWSPTLGRIVIIDANTTRNALTNDSALFAVLTGIPSSSTGSIQYAIAMGDAVVPEVQCDDATAQANLAASEGGDGIHEFVLTEDSFETAAQATVAGVGELFLFKDPEKRAQYRSRDTGTDLGKTVTIQFGNPTPSSEQIVTIIQSIQINGLDDVPPTAAPPYMNPNRDVTASTSIFVLQDLLRAIVLS